MFTSSSMNLRIQSCSLEVGSGNEIKKCNARCEHCTSFIVCYSEASCGCLLFAYSALYQRGSPIRSSIFIVKLWLAGSVKISSDVKLPAANSLMSLEP